MKINTSIFRAYDIRGIYPEDIDEEVAYKIGQAFVQFLVSRRAKKGKSNIVIGRDNRISSPLLQKSLVQGIVDSGANVIDIGLSTTPMLYFAAAHHKFDGGTNITASVDGSEVVLVKDLSSQRQFLTKVKDFIDPLLIREKDSRKFAILSFNPQTGKVQFKPIKNIFRHLSKEKLYEITLKYGRTIKVTEFHSVYTLKDNKVISIPTKNLKINDLITVPNFIPSNSLIPSINLVKELHPFRKQLRGIFVTGSDIEKILLKRHFNLPRRKRRISLIEEGRQILHRKRRKMKLSRRKVAEICNLSPMTIQRIELGKTRKFVKEEYLKKYLGFLGVNPIKNFLEHFVSEKKNFLGHWKGGYTFKRIEFEKISEPELQELKSCRLHGKGFPQYSVRNIINITPELVKLIGYYIAEGNLENKVRVCFNLGSSTSGHEKFIIEDIISSVKEVFGFSPKIYEYENETKVVIDNSIIFGLFAKILGFENKNSLQKKLPDFIFTLPQKYKLELLKTIFLGDGSVDTDGKNIRFNSTSKELIAGISYLFTQMGVTYSLMKEEPARKSRSTMYYLAISNKEDLRKLKLLWVNHWKAEEIKPFCQRKKVSKKKYQRFKHLIFLPIKKIERISPTSKFVYDFSVEEETFIAGAGGVCCHNSHNPPQYNGFKLIREKAIPVSERTGLKEIRKLTLKGKLKKNKKGRIMKKEILKDYLRFIFKDIDLEKIKPLKIIIDTANGVVGILIPEISRKLPCKICHLFPKLDGNFPNHPPDPLVKANLRKLQSEVKREKADLGVAFDGDGDRIIFVDEKGKVIPADLIYALMVDLVLKDKSQQKILYDLRSSNIVKEVVLKRGGIPIMGRVGHSFIKEKMRKENILLAGELSGHYYFKEHYFFESPFFVLFKLLEKISEGEERISEIIKDYQKYFHSGEINFKVKDKKKKTREIERHFQEGKISYLDGLRVDFSDWWFNIRPSNTEPLLRLVIESKSKKLMQEKKEEITKIIQK